MLLLSIMSHPEYIHRDKGESATVKQNAGIIYRVCQDEVSERIQRFIYLFFWP